LMYPNQWKTSTETNSTTHTPCQSEWSEKLSGKQSLLPQPVTVVLVSFPWTTRTVSLP
jgi:hypothetical protein